MSAIETSTSWADINDTACFEQPQAECDTEAKEKRNKYLNPGGYCDSSCPVCDGDHALQNCSVPKKEWECSKCNFRGHISRNCRAKFCKKCNAFVFHWNGCKKVWCEYHGGYENHVTSECNLPFCKFCDKPCKHLEEKCWYNPVNKGRCKKCRAKEHTTEECKAIQCKRCSGWNCKEDECDEKMCGNCQEFGHPSEICWNVKFCGICGEQGHTGNVCRAELWCMLCEQHHFPAHCDVAQHTVCSKCKKTGHDWRFHQKWYWDNFFKELGDGIDWYKNTLKEMRNNYARKRTMEIKEEKELRRGERELAMKQKEQKEAQRVSRNNGTRKGRRNRNKKKGAVQTTNPFAALMEQEC
jgi:hypothetical protein